MRLAGSLEKDGSAERKEAAKIAMTPYIAVRVSEKISVYTNTHEGWIHWSEFCVLLQDVALDGLHSSLRLNLNSPGCACTLQSMYVAFPFIYICFNFHDYQVMFQYMFGLTVS